MSDEKIAKVLELLQKTDLAAAPGLAELREGFVKMIAPFALEPDVACEPVKAGGVPSEWVVASGADSGRAILYLHGGGYVIGSIETHREMASRISRASKAPALVVDYRLAPENPHPAAVKDAVAAYNWLIDEGHDPRKIIIAGDSAGGGLTVATLVALRDAGRPLPAAAVCLSPWIDLEGIGESMTTKADVDPMIAKEALQAWAALYLAGAEARTPLAAPLYADLKGLPPLLIQVGTRETLLDDSVRLAERARQAGVDVELQEYDGMIHIFQIFAAILPEGQQAIDRIGEFVSQRT